jgi:hypothetical protein
MRVPPLKNYVVEKEWSTKHGLEAVVVIHTHHHRCGYVMIPEDHGLFGINYEEIVSYVDVHGGLTFSGTLPFISINSYWLGYDCAHSCDKTCFNPSGIERTLSFCIEECEQLARQLNDSPLSLFYLAKKLGTLSEENHRRMLAFGIQNPNDKFVKEYFEFVGNI